ncbi:MAG: purine-binding chemotaxis protein CheW [Nitrospinae bacterium]|nr:purine-binding chemotaxis protein CheW [Nitrospinota bacterium]
MGEEIENKNKYLSFILSDEEYALNVEDIKEIINIQEITEVPMVPEYIKGIISLRGVIITIFDLRKRLGFQERGYGRDAHIIVLSVNNGQIGIIVDSVTEVLLISERDIEPPPPVIDGIEVGYIKGIGRIKGRIVILLNLNKVL